MSLHIVADENIPYAGEAFSPLGTVHRLPGRQMSRQDLQWADILLVRSITQVDEALLAGTRVRFVGTATIGIDHIDTRYLRANDIHWASAPGCNAVSAAEYVTAAALLAAEKLNRSPKRLTVGIIGCGNVGSRVQKRLSALGMRCLINDPPRARRDTGFQSVDREALSEADLICVHVPLTHEGEDATHHFLGEDFFRSLKPGAVFLNAARGQVVDEAGLKKALADRPDLTLMLDVWENEPCIDYELLNRCYLSTPHIAGYSIDGKLRGTEMLYNALCRHMHKEPAWSAQDVLPTPGVVELSFSDSLENDEIIRRAVLAAYDPRSDDARLRMTQHHPEDERCLSFDHLRKHYPQRREFAAVKLNIPSKRQRAIEALKALEFQVRAI